MSKYEPWLNDHVFGRSDNALNGVRLLVLGESHYIGENDVERASDPSYTSYVVNLHARRRGLAFFTNITQLLCGRHHTQITSDERSHLWDSIAFYNYVSEVVGDGPRVRPTREMFDRSHDAFKDVIQFVSPQCILVLGHENWSALLRNIGKSQQENTPHTMIEGVPAARVIHPNGGFSWQVERPIYEQLLRSAQKLQSQTSIERSNLA